MRSAFGFGEALIAVPLLALVLPLPVATPLAVLVSVTVAGIVVLQDWRHIHLRTAGWLLLFTLPGIPLGLWLLTSPHQQTLRVCLGALILLFAVYGLLDRMRVRLHSDSAGWLAACGFSAGVLGGAFGMNGPALVIYGSLHRWTAQQFRATLQAYFLPASLMGIVGYWKAGLWTGTVTRYYVLALPVVIPAVLIGRAINRRLDSHAFLKYVYVALAGIGCVLMGQAVVRGL